MVLVVKFDTFGFVTVNNVVPGAGFDSDAVRRGGSRRAVQQNVCRCQGAVHVLVSKHTEMFSESC